MADVGLSGVTGTLINWLLSPFIWAVILLGFLFLVVGILIIRKKRKLVYDCVEIVDLGTGKAGFNYMRCGWFGKKSHFKGLWDTGEEVMKTKTGEIIYEFSTEDFQEVNGHRGVVCFRDPINQNILVPLSKTRVLNKELLEQICPATFRDVALDIIKDTDIETKDKSAQLAQWLIMGGLIVLILVAIIVVSQLITGSQEKANALFMSAGQTCLESARNVCSDIFSELSGKASQAGVP